MNSEKKQPTWTVDPVHSSIEFSVSHMGILTVRGRFTKFDIDADFDDEQPDRSAVTVRIDVGSIDTRVEDRDKHLRSADFFDAESFPEMTFRSRRVESLGEGRLKLVGDLTIRDVAREVVLDGQVTGVAKDPWGNERVGFNAQGAISRQAFDLSWNVPLETGGFLVGDEVKIYIESELIKQSQQS